MTWFLPLYPRVSFFSLLFNKINIAFEQPQVLCCSHGKQKKKLSAWQGHPGKRGFNKKTVGRLP
jgi:hypothetical protein